MSAITAKASRKMKKYAVLTREPRCFLGSFDFSWEQRKLGDIASDIVAGGDIDKDLILAEGQYPVIANALTGDGIVGYYDREYRVNAPAVTVTGRGDVGHAKTRLVNFTPVVRLLSVKSEHDVFFLENAINTLKIVIESTGVPQLTVPQLAKYEVAFPRQLDEEKHIGAFFKQLDHLITLHQRKCANLCSPSQVVFSLLFATSTFSWEQRKFEEIAVRSSVICSDDTLPRIEYEDIVSGTGRLNKDIYAKQSSKSGIAFHQGDVLYGKLRPYLQNWLLPTFDGLAVGDFWVLQPQNADSSFLYRLIQSRQFDEVANQSTGTKMPRADWKLVSKTVFSIPSNISEQAAISTYFTALDSLITLHQRECISFAGRADWLILTANKKRTTSSWEQRKLGELVDRVVRKNINNESTLPLTISAQYGLVDQITYFNNRVASRDVSNYYLVLNGEFAYNKSTSDGYPFGAVKRLDLYEKGVLSTLYIVFAPKKEQQIDSDYLTVFFDTDRWHKGVAERAAEGARNHGLLNISAEDFFDIDLSVPKDIVEQKQIGAFIRQLDNLITLHQRKPFLMKWRTSDANRNQANRLVL